MNVNTPNFETAAVTIVYTFVFLLGTIMPSILLCFLGRRRRLLFRYPCFAKESLQVIGLRQLSQFPTSTTACASTEHHWGDWWHPIPLPWPIRLARRILGLPTIRTIRHPISLEQSHIPSIPRVGPLHYERDSIHKYESTPDSVSSCRLGVGPRPLVGSSSDPNRVAGIPACVS